ncbi:hypothetical protein PSECIP111951_00917 [Pseudoalteromonas holothuriae]|uniref:N-acetyltransferase domain-containing protein n=1 Tax=Pseudoalteromonas holothuriae TaxID=2963714 RepID=A0ABN8UJ01_9GAMM|nr:hypothetical protein [Pseudoalteromonas sp. CIP111951]CAH9053902.1 hypothetical protein PSECIP111951_00917 [Pseudoalteromonas sp. CIP111951]
MYAQEQKISKNTTDSQSGYYNPDKSVKGHTSLGTITEKTCSSVIQRVMEGAEWAMPMVDSKGKAIVLKTIESGDTYKGKAVSSGQDTNKEGSVYTTMVQMGEQGEQAYIGQISSSQNAKGLGVIGLNVAARWAKEKPKLQVSLTATGEGNNGAFYEKFGFQIGDYKNRVNLLREIGGRKQHPDSYTPSTFALQGEYQKNRAANEKSGRPQLSNDLQRYAGAYITNTDDLLVSTARYLHELGWIYQGEDT